MTVRSTLPALPRDLSIYTASETRSQWLNWLTDGTVAAATDAPQRLDASQVDTIDAAGLQLLLAFRRTLEARGLKMRLEAPSGPLREACDALGVSDLLAMEHPQ